MKNIKSKNIKSKNIKYKNNILKTVLVNISSLNNNKYFAGIIMLIINIGSKYVSIELSKTQEDYIKYTLGRQLLLFSMLWMGLRDILTALILTFIFIIFADYLFNDTSKFCILNNNYINDNNKDTISNKEIEDAIYILKKARNVKNKNKSNINDKYIKNGLIKENFI
tara:strand:+ start:958 stop:1458 length:501 start_codon:yes stop_codon:yes gene_type:complete